MFFKLALFGALLCSANLAKSTDYDGYKIYDVYVKSYREKEALLRLSESTNYDFFSLPQALEEPARVMVPPSEQAVFELQLTHIRANFSVINSDVSESVRRERMQNNFMRSLAENRTGTDFNSFYRFDEINVYLEKLAAEHQRRVHVRTVGKSYEGRDMKIIIITNGDRRSGKKVVFVDAGIHAREWIAPAAALYIIHQLVENFEENQELLKDYIWVVLPVVNPDGYEFTHTDKRLWRKTRKPVDKNCIGTDGNRNFSFKWGGNGISRDPCSNTFMGPHAFSEPETVVARDIMLSLRGRAKFYLSLHSYGNYLLYPWGYTINLPKTWSDHYKVAHAGAKAILSATGTKYKLGTPPQLLYAASGGSFDYALGEVGIPIAITMEISPGSSGFIVPPEQIQPLVEETWVGVKAMAKVVIENY